MSTATEEPLELFPGRKIWVAMFDSVSPAQALVLLNHYLPKPTVAPQPGEKRKAEESYPKVASTSVDSSEGPSSDVATAVPEVSASTFNLV